MRTPHMTSRRWFWSLLAIVLVWALISARCTHPTADHASGDLGEQNWLANATSALLTPVSRPLTWLQTKFDLMTTSPRPYGDMSPTSSAEAETRIRELTNENLWLRGLIALDARQFAELKGSLSIPIVHSDHLLIAQVVSRSAGVSSETCTIDRGASSGVHKGSIILAEKALVGRVISVNDFTATVRLITDPDSTMRITALQIRPTPNGPPVSIKDNRLVRGIGNGMLRCEFPGVGEPPRAGDLLVVQDNDWGPAMGVVIGTVIEVPPIDPQLRIDQVVQPRVQITQQTQVSVLLAK